MTEVFIGADWTESVVVTEWYQAVALFVVLGVALVAGVLVVLGIFSRRP